MAKSDVKKKKKNSHETRVCTLKENHANPSSSIPILLFLSKPLFLERSFLFSISVYVLLCFTLWSNLASHVCFSLHHICNLLLSLFFFSRSISMPFFFVLYGIQVLKLDFHINKPPSTPGTRVLNAPIFSLNSSLRDSKC